MKINNLGFVSPDVSGTFDKQDVLFNKHDDFDLDLQINVKSLKVDSRDSTEVSCGCSTAGVGCETNGCVTMSCA